MGHPARQLEVISDPRAAATVLEPARLRLMSELEHGPATGADLARRVGEPRQKVNYHLRELERSGLVELVEERKKGNCVERVVRASATAYVVSPEVLGSLGADPTKVVDRLSSAYLIAVCGLTIREVAQLRGRAERAGKKLPTLTLQTEIAFDSQDSMTAFAEELSAEVARLVAKHQAPAGAAETRLFKFFVGGYPAITKPE